MPPRTHASHCLILLSLALTGGLTTTAADPPESTELLQTDSRAPYIHRLTLYDPNGVAISPDDEPAMPYSPRATCGKCHPYALIARGWHFNAHNPNVPAGRPGEPWFLVDEKTGTVLPISGRAWPGTHTPRDAGLTDWQFVLRFGGHTPGGGYGMTSEEAIDNSPESLRWGISGLLEIDCMFCHSADQRHDPTVATKQIAAENFQWAATAALGLAVVRGEAKNVRDDWDPDLPPSPDFPEQAGPTLIYDHSRFDPDDRVLFSITRRPSNDRCYFCHSQRIVGAGAPERWHTEQDVHIAAGLLCVDCHRHGLDHMMTRGYEGESDHPVRKSLTCRGCHLGQGEPAGGVSLGGRYGAPHPQHRGLPPLHLDKLTCTACHSGPWPEMVPKRVQTSLTHGLGQATREREADDTPAILGPVFVRGEDGKIAPQRVVVTTDVSGKKGQLIVWPWAHGVRPTAQSLGARGCEDCHGPGAAIFRGAVVPGREMHDFHGYGPALAGAWSVVFLFRPAFMWFGFVCAALVALVLLRCALDVVTCLCFAGVGSTQNTDTAGTAGGRRGAVRLISFIALLALLVLTITGFGAEWIRGEVSGWPLFAHMLAAPLFVIGLTGIAVLWPARYRLGVYCAPGAGPTVWQKLLFWVALVLGFVTMLSMLVAMPPWCGYAGQEALIEIHETGALLLVIVLILLAIASLVARRRM